MADRKRIGYLPYDVLNNLRFTLGDATLDALDDDARWKLERLLEDVFSQGYDEGWSRGYRFGDDLARSRQKRDEQLAAAIDAAEETPDV